jgi:ribose 5-phosphate isomerase B
MAAATRATKRKTAKRFVVGADDEDDLVQAVITALEELGHEVVVLPKDEWPRVAEQVARAVAGGAAHQGVLFCWTGTGTAMAANKVPGVRAALAWDPWIAEGARRWNDANVLVMSLKRTTPAMAKRILDAWLAIDGPDTDELANIRMLDDLDRARRAK